MSTHVEHPTNITYKTKITTRIGPLPVFVEITEPDGTTVVLRSGRYRVAHDEGLRDACDALLGPGRSRFGARL